MEGTYDIELTKRVLAKAKIFFELVAEFKKLGWFNSRRGELNRQITALGEELDAMAPGWYFNFMAAAWELDSEGKL